MTFDRLITFIHDNKEYDPDSGEYTQGHEVVSQSVANVTDMGTSRASELLGTYKERAKVVRLIDEIPDGFDYLLIDSESYKYVVETSRQPLKNNTLIVSEMK